jgi:hypothetical protein
MNLERKLKIALDETRLLILGAQVLFGFQFNGIFQELFEELPPSLRALACAALFAMVLCVGLLIAPSMQHRIAERGRDSPRTLDFATFMIGCALLPLALGLALDLFLAIDRIAGAGVGALAAGIFSSVAILSWYAMEFAMKRKVKPAPDEQSTGTPLSAQAEQLLTEARLIIPGAQALLGFQLAVTLTRPFAQLPADAKIAHAVALCSMALAIILLVTPASLHRISFGGEADPAFVDIASVFVIAAPVPIGLGIALDAYVATERALDSRTVAAVLAAGATIVLAMLWYVLPLWGRVTWTRSANR